MSEWLKYVHWYASKAQDPWVSLVLYIKRHIVQFLGRLRMKTNLCMVRFGYLWKLYDMVQERGLEYRPPSSLWRVVASLII